MTTILSPIVGVEIMMTEIFITPNHNNRFGDYKSIVSL